MRQNDKGINGRPNHKRSAYFDRVVVVWFKHDFLPIVFRNCGVRCAYEYTQQKRKSARASHAAVSGQCIRNTALEHFHAGRAPVSKTKDGSDIKIIDAEGTEIPWNEVSRITDPEMKEFIKEVVDRTYTFLNFSDDEDFQKVMGRYDISTEKWDAPQIDKGMLGKKLTEKLCKKSD